MHNDKTPAARTTGGLTGVLSIPGRMSNDPRSSQGSGGCSVRECHRRAVTNVHMDDPAAAIEAHASSATPQRLSHRAAAGLNVSSTTVQVLTVPSSTDRTVRRRRTVPTDDPERPAVEGPDPLEDLEEEGADIVLFPCPVIAEFGAGEVGRQITHC